MTQLLLLHSSCETNRASIAAQGLRPHQPVEDGNYPDQGTYLADQPRGIYGFPYVGRAETARWSCSDQWLVAYCGRVLTDPIIPRAVVALAEEPVPATLL